MSRQAAVATAVSQMAAAIEFGSVAEGIETGEQRDLLRKLGYQYGQGYLYSRPVPADRISELRAEAVLPPAPDLASAGTAREP